MFKPQLTRQPSQLLYSFYHRRSLLHPGRSLASQASYLHHHGLVLGSALLHPHNSHTNGRTALYLPLLPHRLYLDRQSPCRVLRFLQHGLHQARDSSHIPGVHQFHG